MIKAGLKLVQQVLDQIGAGDDAHQFAAVNDGDSVEIAASEDFSRFADRGVFLQGDRVLGHDVLQGEGVVERGIDRPFIGGKGVAKADAQDIGEANDANELIAIDDWDVMNAAFVDELADFGDGVAVMHGGDL